jgi:hypothetical protein
MPMFFPGLNHAEPNPPGPVVDQFLATYVYWREGCADVEAAHARWRDAHRSERGAACAAYRAALDREECAARAHEDSMRRLRAGIAATDSAARA